MRARRATFAVAESPQIVRCARRPARGAGQARREFKSVLTGHLGSINTKIKDEMKTEIEFVDTLQLRQ